MTQEHPPRRNRAFAHAKRLLGLAVIVWLGYYLTTRWETLQAVVNARWYHLVGTGIGILVTWTLMSIQGTLLLRSIGAPIGYLEHLWLQLASILVNYLPVRLGPVLRLTYLKKVHDVPVTHFGSLLGVRASILVLGCGLTGLAADAVDAARGQPLSLELTLVFAGLTAAALAAYLVPLPRFESRQGALFRTWRQILDGVELARSKPKVLAAVLGLVVLQIVTVAARLVLTYRAVQFDAGPTLAIKVASLAALVNLLAFTMGSLGLREAVIGHVTAASGHDFSTGVFAGVVDRAMLLLLTYPLGLLGLFLVNRRLARAGSPPPTEGSVPLGEEKEVPER